MNKSAALFLILTIMGISFITIKSANALTDQWVEKAPMPTARSSLGVVAVNSTIYAIGGLAKALDEGKHNPGTTNVNEAYDTATDTWVEKAPMPGPNWLDSFGIAAYQGKIYCIGGPANNVYDPATDKWEAKTAMPTSRHFLSANVVNGKIYMIGGLALEPTPWQNKLVNDPSFKLISYSFSDKNEVYDPVTNSWTAKASLPQAVAFYSSSVVNNKIYIISGSTRDNHTGLVQVYDPQTDNWSSASPIPTPVEYAAAGAIINAEMPSAIYVIGGYTQRIGFTNQTNLNQVYFPESDSWVMSISMPVNRTGSSIVAVNNVLYAIGGAGDTIMYSSTTYQYTPTEIRTPPPTMQPAKSPSPAATEQPTSPPPPQDTLTLPPEVDIALGAIAVTVIVSAAVLLWKKPK